MKVLKNGAVISSKLSTCLQHSQVGKISNNRIPSLSAIRTVTTNSWAADRLEEIGAKIEKEEQKPDFIFEEKMLYEPTDKVTKLGDALLKLTAIEYAQVTTILEVTIYFYFFIMKERSIIMHIH